MQSADSGLLPLRLHGGEAFLLTTRGLWGQKIPLLENEQGDGAGNGTRTCDLLITNQLLYRLSYTSKYVFSADRHFSAHTTAV